MYVGTFNDTKKCTWPMYQIYEKHFGDIHGLIAQDDFTLICPKK